MKVSLSNITNGQNVSAINDNFTQISDALNTGTLWRVNPINEPNQMENLLDMNGFQIINVVLIPPSSNAGLPNGAVWNDNGILRVVS